MCLINYLLAFTLKFSLLSREEKFITMMVSETVLQWVTAAAANLDSLHIGEKYFTTDHDLPNAYESVFKL